tara:strand:+ start:445 stop:945 length:501 start_codon:yes stop_codon:yes gene_type:complete
MSSFRVRPRFRQVINLAPEAVQQRIVNQIDEDKDRCDVKTFPGFVRLRIPEEQRHFWSPRLTLSLNPEDEGKTSICGVYGPNANVWALFLYGYFIIGFLGMISGVLAISQWVIEVEPWAVWPFGAAMAGLIALYVVAQMGQKLGAMQTFQLHQAYEAAIGKHAEIR